MLTRKRHKAEQILIGSRELEAECVTPTRERAVLRIGSTVSADRNRRHRCVNQYPSQVSDHDY